MAALDEANVEKKFRGVAQTQESIQSLTLWVIHHKAQHEKIVEIWFKVLKKSKISHRLTLLYLCNDIVQTCKRKHAIIYKDAFKDVLKDAILMVRDNDIRNSVHRIFGIWEERNVYDKEFLEELSSILNNTKVRSTMNSKLLAEFKPQDLVEMITKMKTHDDDISIRSVQLSNLRLDASNVEAVKQLKDRSQGKEFFQDFEESCTKLENFVSDTEKGRKERVSLIELLEQSELFYDAQYGEAKIVANAYKNFGTRVNNLSKRLGEHKKTLNDPMSPVPSPTVDAPSPGNTPPSGPHEDIMDAVDMDVSDEEGTGKRNAAGHRPKGIEPPNPLVPVNLLNQDTNFFTQFSPESQPVVMPFQTSTTAHTPQDTPVIPWGAPPAQVSVTNLQQSNSANLVQLTQGGSTPVNDEGSSTPVQDEKPDSSLSANPIEFLTQLISQSQKTNSSNTASFFENLSMLTDKVKSKVVKEDLVPAPTTPEVPLEEQEYDPGQELPPAPAWEPWSPQAEEQTPSYVPDIRPTPRTMPFGEIPMENEPYADEPHPHGTPYTPDAHIFPEPHSPEPYNIESQPYLADGKPDSEGYTADSQDSQIPASLPGQLPYVLDPLNPPPPPPPLYSLPSNPPFTDAAYNPATETLQQPPISAPFIPSSVPPPPPPDVPTSDAPPGHYPPSFYQEPTHTPSPDTPPGEGPPLFQPPPPPPPGDWELPFSTAPPGSFAPPPPLDSSPEGHETNTSVYMPPGPNPSAVIMQPPGMNNVPPPFGIPPQDMEAGAPPPPELFPGAPPPAPFPGAPPPAPFPGAPPPAPFPGFRFNHPGAPEPPRFNPPPLHDQQHFGAPPLQDQPRFNMPPMGDPRFNLPLMGMPRFNMPPSSGPPPPGPPPPLGESPHQFNINPSSGPPPELPMFNRHDSAGQHEQTDMPMFNRRNSSGPPDQPPDTIFNRRNASGPQDQPFGRMHPHNMPPEQHQESTPLKGILRHSRPNNLTTIQTTEFSSPSSNSDQDSVSADVSSIPTMLGKGRPMHSPRPPSQPPTPGTPNTPLGGGIRMPFPKRNDQEDQEEFIEKLKRKSFTPTITMPSAPPKGILKNTSQAGRNLRSLAEVSSEDKTRTSTESSKSVSDTESAEGIQVDQEPQAPLLNEEPSQESLISNDQTSSRSDKRSLSSDSNEKEIRTVQEKIQQLSNEGTFRDEMAMEYDECDNDNNMMTPERDVSRSPLFSREAVFRRQSFEGNREGLPPYDPRPRMPPPPFGRDFSPRFSRHRPPPPGMFDRFRDSYGRPFPKRLPPPRYEQRFRPFRY